MTENKEELDQERQIEDFIDSIGVENLKDRLETLNRQDRDVLIYSVLDELSEDIDKSSLDESQICLLQFVGRLKGIDISIDGKRSTQMDQVFRELVANESDTGEEKDFEKFASGNYESDDNEVKTIELDNGEKITSYDKIKYGSVDSYLDKLSRNLDTPYKVNLFVEEFFKYTHDAPPGEKYTKKGSVDNSGQYTQSPAETVKRQENGRMLGDCDDIALFMTEVLKRQGKEVYNFTIPGHALCLGVERIAGGNYVVFTVDSNGLDINGNRVNVLPDDSWHDEKFVVDSLEKGLKRVERKYHSFPKVEKGDLVDKFLKRERNLNHQDDLKPTKGKYSRGG